MIRAFMDLAENVALLITKDRKIVYYEDFDYSNSTLDVVFSKLTELGIEEICVMLHGVVSDKLQTGSVHVANAYAVESDSDYKALTHLFSALGISTVYFYDFAGHWMFGLEDNSLVVVQDDGQYHLIVYSNGIKSCGLATESNLSQQVMVLCNKYELKHVVDADSLVHKPLLNYFENVGAMKESLYHRLSLFAFMMTTESEEFRVGKLENTAGTMKEALRSEDTSNEPKASEGVKSVGAKAPATKQPKVKQPKEPKAKEPKVKQPKTKEPKEPKAKGPKVFTFGTVVTSVLLAVAITAVSIGGSKILQKRDAEVANTLNTLNTRLQTENSQSAAYKRALASDGVTASSSLSVLSKMDFKGCTGYNADAQTGSLTVIATSKNEKNAKVFLTRVKKKFKVTDSLITKQKGVVTTKVVVTTAD